MDSNNNNPRQNPFGIKLDGEKVMKVEPGALTYSTPVGGNDPTVVIDLDSSDEEDRPHQYANHHHLHRHNLKHLSPGVGTGHYLSPTHNLIANPLNNINQQVPVPLTVSGGLEFPVSSVSHQVIRAQTVVKEEPPTYHLPEQHIDDGSGKRRRIQQPYSGPYSTSIVPFRAGLLPSCLC